MVTTMQAQNKSMLTVSTYGESADVISLSRRIKIMVPGGNKLTDNEAQALAQVSLVTKCNPFIGEIWYIPGRGPMIGIKGARRHGNEHIEQAGGRDAFWVADLSPCSGEDAGYKGDIKDLAAAYKCVITDSVSTGLHQRMFLETVNSLRAAGSKDPVGEAREIIGKRPQWVEYGFATVSENSKMNKQALARKRAEAAALKLKFDIPFGADVAVGDDAVEAGDWIDHTDDISHITGEAPSQALPREQAVTGSVAQQETTPTVEDIRPYVPERLRGRLHEIARAYQKKNKLSATIPQRSLVASVLTECFAGNPIAEDIRHKVTKYLIDFESVGQNGGAPGMYVLALLDWLAPTKDSGGAYRADPIAVKEALAVADMVIDKEAA